MRLGDPVSGDVDISCGEMEGGGERGGEERNGKRGEYERLYTVYIYVVLYS